MIHELTLTTGLWIIALAVTGMLAFVVGMLVGIWCLEKSDKHQVEFHHMKFEGQAKDLGAAIVASLNPCLSGSFPTEEVRSSD